MRRKRFSVEPIVAVPKPAEIETTVSDVVRHAGVSVLQESTLELVRIQSASVVYGRLWGLVRFSEACSGRCERKG